MIKTLYICDRCSAEARTDEDKGPPPNWAIQQFQFPLWPARGGHRMLCPSCIRQIHDWLNYPNTHRVVESVVETEAS